MQSITFTCFRQQGHGVGARPVPYSTLRAPALEPGQHCSSKEVTWSRVVGYSVGLRVCF